MKNREENKKFEHYPNTTWPYQIRGMQADSMGEKYISFINHELYCLSHHSLIEFGILYNIVQHTPAKRVINSVYYGLKRKYFFTLKIFQKFTWVILYQISVWRHSDGPLTLHCNTYGSFSNTSNEMHCTSS